jgi:protease-4
MILIFLAPQAWHLLKKEWDHHFITTNQIGYLVIDGKITHASIYRKDLINFFKNPAIKAILVKIESSGGSIGSCQALAFDIEHFKKEYPKPIITYVENICTCGAYQIAAATDHIVATGSALIGNIGPEEQNLTQTLTDNMYQQMSKEIAFKRHLQLSKIDQWGQGKTFTGQQAYDLKLIDSVGSKTTAINLIKKNIIPSNKRLEWIIAPNNNRFRFHLNTATTTEDDDINVLQ